MALRKVRWIAWLIASHLGHLAVEAGQHLVRTGQDGIYALRLLLLLRERRRLPEHALQIDSAISRLREERSKLWSAWKMAPLRRQLEVRAASAVLVLVVLFAAHSYFTVTPTDGSFGQLTDQARAVARKWQPDADLVQVELIDFGFAIGPSGIPDTSKAGPPAMVLFNFLSRSAHDAIRVVAQPNLTPEQLKLMASRGVGPVRVEHLSSPYSPYTLPIPEGFIDPQQAVARAYQDIGPECGGASLEARSCSLVSDAELHLFWSGPGENSSPVWTIRFGQNPRTLRTVTREVSAASGELVALTDLQRGSLSTEPGQRLKNIVLHDVGNDFDSVWRAVNQAVAKQDALYKPYTVSLITYLSDKRRSDVTVNLSEVEFQYARITPSFYWDDTIVHVRWTGSTAVLDVSPSVPRHSPEEPVPRTLEAQSLPSEDATLRKILNVFPPGYLEQTTTWERGCRNKMTVSPRIKQWECGVLVETVHRTDQVYIWMTRQGNPYWESAAAPLQSEHSLISNNAPQDMWVLWTRLKRANQWQYVVVNAATGIPTTTTGLCTLPPNGTDPRPATIEACG
jgi:hypothetical protein